MGHKVFSNNSFFISGRKKNCNFVPSNPMVPYLYQYESCYNVSFKKITRLCVSVVYKSKATPEKIFKYLIENKFYAKKIKTERASKVRTLLI